MAELSQDTTVLMPPDSLEDVHPIESSRETGGTQCHSFAERVVVRIEDQSSDLLGANKQGRKVGLWLSDAILLCLEHLQIFALILSLSLGWAWPQVWISGTSFAFLLNLDLWEFIKVHSVYEGQLQAFVDPAQIPFSYLGYSIAWLVVIVLLAITFALTYIVVPRIPYFGVVYSLLFRAKLVRLFALVAHVLSLPFGLVVVRLFDCQNYPSGPNGALEYRSVVLKDTQCWSSPHLGILVPLLVLSVACFIVLPCWMIYTIRSELVSPVICTCRTWRTHENYLRLKEAEYLQGLDIAWETKHYPLFSSFRRPWVWFRPFSFFVKAILLAVYGSLFYVPYYQTIVLFTCVCVIVLVLAIVPVYRLQSFNFMLIFSIVVNLCNLVIGLVLVLRVQSSLLIGFNLTNALIVINVTWLIIAGAWFCFLIVSNSSFFEKRFGPMWPTLTEVNWSRKDRSDHTRKFFNAILTGRKVLEKCYSVPSLFGPVHELSRQIQIINAYYREAEVLDDSTHTSLWALLAEMIDLYNHLLPLSVFGASRTDQVYPHIQKLMDLMPAFTRKLEQREYDFILVTPRKRRILLKLLAVATFLRRGKKSATTQHSSRASYRVSQVSTLTHLFQDNHTKENDQFISKLDKWEADRQGSIGRFPSLGSLKTEDDYTYPSRSHSAYPYRYSLNSPPANTCIRASSSAGSNCLTPGDDKTSRPASKLSVRFNPLNTIAEYESGSRKPSAISYRTESPSSTDHFLDKVSEQFDFQEDNTL